MIEWKALICGSRHHTNKRMVWDAISSVHAKTPISMVITGAATGGDAFGEAWARQFFIPYRGYPAIWRNGGKFNPAAGPIRNRLMFDIEKPDVCLAFPLGDEKTSPGTWDMITVCRAYGLEPIIFDALR